MKHAPPAAKGFSLVEILIVVVLLAILAAIVIPQVSNATQDARTTALLSNLQTIRSRLEVYKVQHRDRYPDERFVEQMVQYTDEAGDVNDVPDPDYPLGPYLCAIPPNPFSGDTTVEIVTGTTPFVAPDEDGGWWYNATTGEFRAVVRADRFAPSGIPLAQLIEPGAAQPDPAPAPEPAPAPPVAIPAPPVAPAPEPAPPAAVPAPVPAPGKGNINRVPPGRNRPRAGDSVN